MTQENDGSLLATVTVEDTDPNWRVAYGNVDLRPNSIQLTLPDGRELTSKDWMTTNTQIPWDGGARRTIIEGRLSNCSIRPGSVAAGEAISFSRFSLSNFIFLGALPVTTRYRQREQISLSKIDLDIDGFEASLRQVPNYDEITKKVRKNRGIDVTTQLRIRPKKIMATETTYMLVENICTLLSLASSNHVTWITAKCYGHGGRLISTELTNGVTRPYTPLALINLNDGAQIKALVEHGMPNLTRWNGVLSSGPSVKPLRNAIRLSLDAKRGGTYLQSRALTAVIVVELLNSELTAANGHSGLVPSSQFKKLRDSVKTTLRESAIQYSINLPILQRMLGKIAELNRPSFQDGINSLLIAAGINVQDSQIREFLKIRNSLVHTGDFLPKSGKSPPEQFNTVLEFVDQILLGLVGYQGSYLGASNQWQLTALNYRPSPPIKQTENVTTCQT